MSDFGGKLRLARERRGISLRQIAASTKISVGALEALERNDVSKLPGGIFSRAFVRSYAVEVGLDPDDTVDEFCRLFTQGDRRAEGTLRDIAAIISQPSTYQDEPERPAQGERRRQSPPVDATESPVHAPQKGRTWRDHLLRVMRNARPDHLLRVVRNARPGSPRTARSAHTN